MKVMKKGWEVTDQIHRPLKETWSCSRNKCRSEENK